jgi:hypothetical protein
MISPDSLMVIVFLDIHGRPPLPSAFLHFGITREIAAHTSGLGLRREAAGPDGIRWSMPDHYDGLLKSPVQRRLDRPRSDL